MVRPKISIKSEVEHEILGYQISHIEETQTQVAVLNFFLPPQSLFFPSSFPTHTNPQSFISAPNNEEDRVASLVTPPTIVT